MFTRRHYEAIAAILNGAAYLPQEQYYGLAPDAGSADRRILRRRIAGDLADLFAGDNPRFNRARFLTACGLEN